MGVCTNHLQQEKQEMQGVTFRPLALILLLPYCLYSREDSLISILISSMNFIKPSHFKLGCLVVSEGLVHTLGLL